MATVAAEPARAPAFAGSTAPAAPESPASAAPESRAAVATESGDPVATGLRILAIDERPLLRAGLAGVARRALGCRAQPVADTTQAVAAARMMGGTPHVVLLGLRADQDAVAAVREARRMGAPVICAVDIADAAVVRAALDAGADGYLALHAADPDAVRHAVGGALEGQVVVPAELQAPAPRGRPGGGLAVTARGREVLRSLAEGLHDEEVAAQLGISTSSVRKHIATCQERLQARTRTQLVAIAAQSGLL